MLRKGLLSLLALTVVSSSFAPLPAQANSRKCPKVTTSQIEALFDQWNQSLQTGDPNKVADNYAKDAVLLPTVSNQVRNTREKIVDYFVGFLQNKPVGVINEKNVRIYCDKAINSGIYTFTLTNNGQTQQVPARYTFVYRKIGDKWLIVDHHSSKLPE
ncbi:MAG TPA: SgcJ/EcaC family oxidoreductase [Nostocaceae cyanobacterium]|nr:SgcJ/EcaC family oxidoreductase [Nostocaceae cyanobacterium]